MDNVEDRLNVDEEKENRIYENIGITIYKRRILHLVDSTVSRINGCFQARGF